MMSIHSRKRACLPYPIPKSLGLSGYGRATWFLLFFICSIYIFPVLSGCKEHPKVAPTASPAVPESEDSSTILENLQVRLDKLLEPVSYHYTPAGKPDPFQPFLKTPPRSLKKMVKRQQKPRFSKPEYCETPLKCMDVGQLTLVAVVMKDDGHSWAMAQDASGIGYVLTAGTRIGYRNGVVKEIRPNMVVVQEESEDIRGQIMLQSRLLLLHPEEK